MAKFGLIKWIGKALGCIALPLVCALFATYAKHHMPGWAFALSLLLVVAGSVPAVLFFNLFRDSSSKAPGKRFEFSKQEDEWDDLFSPWHRDDDDRN
ncbi:MULTISPECIES: hypothetical protein [unclassified Pseudomonas]|uniref:hypothetical protein n=1 Tax=unclassified Pseudomonas TaxID=196821 RepID=UPI000C86CF45|nr:MULTISPECIES: hypothetical protein [unclassified Pseudomonas]PMV91215.1 hypothetical protein C1X55_31405 [Pseudomonas sp. GW460-C8]PMW23308.1 hypothetical protein C1X53_12155 [Pseudomonas sp. GW456-E6]PMW24216.1 hypothetical protein C1X40_05230 [Pseudomonas sp. GW456-11-11-14-TSB2]PMW40110.1 hypothetical protein C1X45_08540 [Pseudomonas sp. GW460-7]PMW41221.1 hypothetical protein C1X48_07175 [Pseudomonas sp. FW305-3-2-15-A-R2A1]